MVVDDERRTLELLQDVVSRHPDFQVVGVARDGRTAITACAELCPDLVLMDIVMPGSSGLEAIRAITGKDPQVKCLALTAVTRPDVLFEALQAGACGYLLKAAPAAELYHAMRGTLTGESVHFISSDVIGRAASQAVSDPDLTSRLTISVGSPVELTARELDVVRQLANGCNNKEIGDRLFLSEATVKSYLGALCRKLGVRDRMQLLIRCQELGLVWPSLKGSDTPGSVPAKGIRL
ncbi:MAG: response regulator transcription factor [Micropruina sp.]|uniref:response regulator n=1 Tax=Micropruina sp. TaxID=2737536 RepID=UPI0039E6A24F